MIALFSYSKPRSPLSGTLLSAASVFALLLVAVCGCSAANFTGVSDSIQSSFCSRDARPGFKVDVALMLVHVRRAVSFNYKLYLISGDRIVQTGQVVPRDDFRIHAFPVRDKSLAEFAATSASNDSRAVTGDEFARFLRQSEVQLPRLAGVSRVRRGVSRTQRSKRAVFKQQLEKLRAKIVDSSATIEIRTPTVAVQSFAGAQSSALPEDADAALLPGDELPQQPAPLDLNAAIQFDDQPSASYATGDEHLQLAARRRLRAAVEPAQVVARDPRANRLFSAHDASGAVGPSSDATASSGGERTEAGVVPVGAFSSFVVNVTYLVRKDFDEVTPQVMQLEIDAKEFQATRMSYVDIDDNAHWQACDFLTHALLRNNDTRIVSVSQIYDSWIGKTFNTFVYIQRRVYSGDSESDSERTLRAVVSERLVFAESSKQLIGVDSLGYRVLASAFITELKGLHYFLEFIDDNKFRLSAVSWSQKPYVIFDGARFALKPLRTKLDNQELLLCPPAICTSEQPVDEVLLHGPDERQSVRLLLRDWSWKLAANARQPIDKHATFALDFASGLRNDLKPASDNYGFPLVGGEVDATFRVGDDLYAVSVSLVAQHLRRIVSRAFPQN